MQDFVHQQYVPHMGIRTLNPLSVHVVLKVYLGPEGPTFFRAPYYDFLI